MKNKGVQAVRFDSGQGKRLWLSLILTFLCAALVCCAFLLPNIGKNEINSAKAYTTEAQSTFSKIKDGYVNHGSTNTETVAYSTLINGTASTSQVKRTLTFGKGKLTTSIGRSGTNAMKGYISFSATVEVPAYTEYTVTYKFKHTYTRTRTGTSGSGTYSEFLYFGDSGHGGSDLSSTLNFPRSNGTQSDYRVSYFGSSAGTISDYENVLITITYTNDTNEDNKPFTAYFGQYCSATTVGTGSISFEGKVELLSEEIEATDTAVPVPDKSEAEYNASGNNINFLYDKNSVNFNSVSYVDVNGNSSDVTSSCALDADGNCKLFDAGTYTFSFDIKPNLCLVWDTTGDKDTKEVSVTINPKVLQVNWTEQAYDNGETGSDSLYFMLPALNVTQTVKDHLTEVRYYHESNYDVETGAVTGSPVDLEDIQVNNVYYAVVALKDGLSDNNYSVSGRLYSRFDTSDSRTVIVVDLSNSGEVYDQKPHPAVAKAVTTDGVELTVGTDIDFQYTYYMDGDGVYGSGSAVPPTNAGVYKVAVAIKPHYNADYKPYDTMEFEYVIEKANPVLDPVRSDTTELVAGAAMPEIVYNAANASATPGTYTWTATKLISGTNSYGYTFTPDSEYADNYNTASGTLEFTTEDAKITSISVEWKYTDEEGNPLDGDGNPLTVYDSWKLDDLKQYLKVSGMMNNGNTVDNIIDYKLTGTLGAGDKTITVRYTKDETVQCQFTVEGIVACELVEITAEFSPDENIYTSTDVESYKDMLVVYAVYNDGRIVEIGGDDYSLLPETDEDGNLVKGNQDITVTYVDEDGNEYTTTFEVNIKEVLLSSLKAEFANILDKITSTTPLDDLKKWLTVTGVNNDGSEFAVTEYELSGKLEGGKDSTITVKYGGRSTTFKVTVEADPVPVKKTLLPVPQIKETAYTGEEIDILDGWEHIGLVDVAGNKNTIAATYTLVLKIKDFDTYEWDTTGLKPKSGAKGLAKYALAVEYEGYSIEGDTLTAEWKITPAVLTGTWNDQGTLDLLSSSYKGETVGLVQYTYYNKDGEEADPTALIVGETYTVQAVLVDATNFEFDAATAQLVAEPHEFKMELPPVGGIQAVWNTMNSKMAGLPLWAWIAIGLALLALIIIIIVVAVARKKKREEEKKEKEKLEREERMMRIQSGMGAASQMPITAAAMLAAQQQPQMPVQPQPQPMQQQAMPAPVQAQVQQAMPAPVQQPAPAVASNTNGVSSADISALEERLRRAEDRARYAEERIARDAEERARAAEERVLRAAEERARLAEEQLMRNAYTNRAPANGAENGNISLDALGALVLAALKNYTGGEQPEKLASEQQQMIDVGSATMPAVYPPDAVITTTTTVDTTKKSAEKFSRPAKVDVERSERNGFADVDGFYDEI